MPATIRDQDARYALDLVKTICEQVGPGLPGSSQERERAEIIRQELETLLGADNVVVEEFQVAPGAFLGSFQLSAVLLLAAMLLNISMGSFPGIAAWLTPLAALVLAILAPLPFLLEYSLYREVIDPFFPQKKSVNVIGRLRTSDTGTGQRLLMLSGHHDSALESTWIRFLGYGFYLTIPTLLLGYIVMLAMSAIQLAGSIAGNSGIIRFGTLGWVLLAYPLVPAIIVAMFFNRGRKNGGIVPGAVDNLSASAVVVAMCRFLVNNPGVIPPGTEIRFISFGSEEAGLRGSRRYVERHYNELKKLDAWLLNFEMVAYPEILITTSDVGGVQNSPEMVASLVQAAGQAGVPFKVAAYPTGGGGSDAGSFSQAGFKAATLIPFKIPQQIVAFHHQKWDRPERLTIEPLLNVMKLSLEWISSENFFGSDIGQSGTRWGLSVFSGWYTR